MFTVWDNFGFVFSVWFCLLSFSGVPGFLEWIEWMVLAANRTEPCGNLFFMEDENAQFSNMFWSNQNLVRNQYGSLTALERFKVNEFKILVRKMIHSSRCHTIGNKFTRWTRFAKTKIWIVERKIETKNIPQIRFKKPTLSLMHYLAITHFLN